MQNDEAEEEFKENKYTITMGGRERYTFLLKYFTLRNYKDAAETREFSKIQDRELIKQFNRERPINISISDKN